MTRGEAVALIVGLVTVVLAGGLSALGWYVNRRVAAWTSVLERISALEAKYGLIDVGGTHGNREAIRQVRRDLEMLEDLHRKDLIEVDRRMGTQALGMAQLAERVNAYAWGRPTRRVDTDPPEVLASGKD